MGGPADATVGNNTRDAMSSLRMAPLSPGMRRPVAVVGPRQMRAIVVRVDLLVTDPVTGKVTGLRRTVRRVLAALRDADVPYCVIGATALAVRGLPRMTRDLDIAVLIDD